MIEMFLVFSVLAHVLEGAAVIPDASSAVARAAHLREVNAVLALLVSFGLFYRFPQALRGVSSKRLFVALALFPPLVGLGSASAYLAHAPVGPVIPLATAAYLFLGWVCVFWPPRLAI